VARSLEAHNDLDKAIEQYEFVARTWPQSAEAKHAGRLAQALRKPENVAFYKELYAYKPIEAIIPPMGTGGFTLPAIPGVGGLSLPLNHPPVDGPTIPAGSILPPLPPPGTSGTMPARDSLLDTPLPGDVFTPDATTPKAEPARPAPRSPADDALPGDVFTPGIPSGEAKAGGTPKR